MSLIKSMTPSREDLVASIGVFFVAVPLSLGIALASGTSPASGMIAAIIGGIVVGLMSGAPLMVSGPAAGLSALALQYVMQYGIIGLAWITVFAGIMQFFLGVFRTGKFFEFVPASILSGMLAAIGAIIALGQVYILFGSSIPGHFLKNVTELPSLFSTIAQSSTLMMIGLFGALGIAIQLAWPKLGAWTKKIPGALPAVAIVTLAALSFELPRIEITSIFADAGNSFQTLLSSQLMSQLGPYLGAALGLALVASAETLLTARAIHGLTSKSEGKVDRSLDLNKELKAQGIGNFLSGGLGGLPITGVIVRSAANVSFGAQTRASAVLHGVWIVLFFLLFPSVVAAIPLTVLASILIMTGFKLLNPMGAIKLLKTNLREGVLWFVTFGAIVSTNLLTGLGIAIGCAVIAYYKEILNAFINRDKLKGDDKSPNESAGLVTEKK
jgi:MFS superfamily sulfate permease-like transporter